MSVGLFGSPQVFMVLGGCPWVSVGGRGCPWGSRTTALCDLELIYIFAGMEFKTEIMCSFNRLAISIWYQIVVGNNYNTQRVTFDTFLRFLLI